MKNTAVQSQEDAIGKLYAFVIDQMKAGADKPSISQKLVDMGVDKDDAPQVVEKIHAQVLKAAEQEKVSAQSILGAVIGGSLAAVVGGYIWALIVTATGFEVGYMAWGIGLLAGFAVLFLSHGKRGVPLQLIAVLASVFGIVVGKYFIFFHYVKEAVAEKYGAAAASSLSVVSEKVVQLFAEKIDVMLSGFDILWVALAVVTAWRIPRGLGIKFPR